MCVKKAFEVTAVTYRITVKGRTRRNYDRTLHNVPVTGRAHPDWSVNKVRRIDKMYFFNYLILLSKYIIKSLEKFGILEDILYKCFKCSILPLSNLRWNCLILSPSEV